VGHFFIVQDSATLMSSMLHRYDDEEYQLGEYTDEKGMGLLSDNSMESRFRSLRRHKIIWVGLLVVCIGLIPLVFWPKHLNQLEPASPDFREQGEKFTGFKELTTRSQGASHAAKEEALPGAFTQSEKYKAHMEEIEKIEEIEPSLDKIHIMEEEVLEMEKEVEEMKQEVKVMREIAKHEEKKIKLEQKSDAP